jgi:hypothetical protein
MFNLDPVYNHHFTVSKYLHEDINSVNEYKSEPIARSCAVPLSDCFVGDENDEAIEMLARVTYDEWAMADEALWGPSNPSITMITITPSVMVIRFRS